MPVLPIDLADMQPSKMLLRFSIQGGIYEYSGETVGISPNHFIMTTLAKVTVGSRLLVKIRVPVEASDPAFCEVAVSAQIVSGSKLSDGKFGYEAKIEHC